MEIKGYTIRVSRNDSYLIHCCEYLTYKTGKGYLNQGNAYINYNIESNEVERSYLPRYEPIMEPREFEEEVISKDMFSVMNDGSPEFEECITYWNKTYNQGLSGYSYSTYYNSSYTTNGILVATGRRVWKNNTYTPKEYIKKFINSKENMKVIYIKRSDLKQIHEIACVEWKTKIQKYGMDSPFEDKIRLTKEQVTEMFNAATKYQRPVLESIFGDFINEPDLAEIKMDANQYMEVDGSNSSIRLSNKYTWLIDSVIEDGVERIHLIIKKKNDK